MAKYPLLIFPTYEKASRTRLSGGSGRFQKPTPQRQWERLSPSFKQLQAAFEARRVEIQQTAAGTDPEQVLVIETIGSIDQFANAVKRIPGLEWMGEIEIDEITPDEDFYDESKPEKELSGRLYLVMTNQRALEEMLSLWRRYQANPDMQFEYGLTKFRDVFLQLRSIRRWDVQDRLLETGIIEIWKEDLEINGDRIIPFEVELWFRKSDDLRTISAERVTELVHQAGGRIISQSVIEGIAYHGILAELPANAIRAIVENPNTELVKCENVMFFRPAGQMMVGDRLAEGEVEISTIEKMPLPSGEPIVAIFDGMPLSNHRLLAERVIVDDPDNWEAEYAANERIHGTAMASLIVHGDLNHPNTPLSRPVYLRPIMKPLDWPNAPRPEGVPAQHLIVDIIHRAVKRVLEGEQGENPVAPSIKIINLSVGDRARQFTQSISPLARLLDWLSVKYGVLFIVSAGNHTTPIELGISRNEFDTLRPEETEAEIVKALYRDARNRRLLSPAETINGLTIGAVHHDDSRAIYLGGKINPFEQLLPSPVSAFGSGYRRSIKPDMVFYGGKQLYELPLDQREPFSIQPAIFRTPPGNKVASPGRHPGELTATSYTCGTSNATALVSRSAGIYYDSLRQIFREQTDDIDPADYEIPLLKAMLVHGCSWDDMGSLIASILRTPGNGRQLNRLVSRWIGYGMPQMERVLYCTEQRATILGFGELSDGDAHIFSLPLPPSLGSRPEWRRLTVTLAWLSPIFPNTQKYRAASLWFELDGNQLTPTRRGASSGVNWRAARRGTIQHEVFEGEKAEPFIDGDVIKIKVNCRKDAGRFQNPIAYGLVISLEVSEGIDIDVYNEIRTRISPVIRIQQSIEPG